MLIGPPPRVPRLTIDSHMPPIDNGYGIDVPGFCVVAGRERLGYPDRLHVFPEIRLNRFYSIFIQHQPGQKNGKFSSAAMSSVRMPAGMALLGQAIQIDSILSEIDQKRLFLFLRKIQGKKKTGK